VIGGQIWPGEVEIETLVEDAQPEIDRAEAFIASLMQAG
jgi:hypothetical protein